MTISAPPSFPCCPLYRLEVQFRVCDCNYDPGSPPTCILRCSRCLVRSSSNDPVCVSAKSGEAGIQNRKHICILIQYWHYNSCDCNDAGCCLTLSNCNKVFFLSSKMWVCLSMLSQCLVPNRQYCNFAYVLYKITVRVHSLPMTTSNRLANFFVVAGVFLEPHAV